MFLPFNSRIIHCGAACLLVWLTGAGFSVPLAADEAVDFNRDIRPLLSDRCFKCHGPDAEAREAELRFDQVSGKQSPFFQRGGTAVIVPGDLEKSTLWERLITEDPDLRMPPPDSKKPPLNKAEKELFKKWIQGGARFDAHWSFVTPQRSEPVDHPDARWNGGEIDRLVGARLQQEKLSPQPRADRRTLLRRLSLDLVGLPPTPAEIRQFLEDREPGAYKRQVDRLLARRGYGEHMARYWLDLVRFADTNGIHHDHFREVTPYRDWVIDSFNQNLRFDKFIEYQIAGDLFPKPTTEQLVASGFNRLHLVIDRGTALPEESFHRNVVDRVTAFGTVFLGLTVQCAQCHEHKYDPISQKDFYGLYAFFNNIDAAPETPGRNRHAPFLAVPTPDQVAEIEKETRQISTLETRIAKLEQKQKQAAPKPLDKKTQENDPAAAGKLPAVPEELETVRKELATARKRLEAIRKAAPTTLIMKERKQVRETRIRIRGVYDQLGEKVERQTPGFLPPLQQRGEVPDRMDLARWVTDPGNPLTARVAVNRIWQQFFGVGLVKTSEDFGAQGERPSHVDLLDNLSLRFVESGWNVKQLVREMVLSETYRQSSVATPAAFQADIENRLLARGSRFRLDAETIRDQILLVSGQLNREMYGRSVKPPQPPNLWKSVSMVSSSTYAFKADTGDKIRRRSLYSFWKRAMPPPQMTLFDAPTRESCIARRERTNTPLQALVLMNEEQYFAAAKQLAITVMRNLADDRKRIDHLYESLTAQLPDDNERMLLLKGLNDLKESYRSNATLRDEVTAGLQLGQLPGEEVAAYTLLINSLFNLDITKTRN
ncbi:MAG: DUF1553 domain-containing protein [Planctomycetota bacterium]|nr:DUF1553 domain-containing protein [Planctomycetota bacterium]